MNKTLKFIITTILILVGLAIGYTAFKNTSTGKEVTADKASENPIANSITGKFSEINQGPAPQPTAGKYLPYTDKDFAAATGKRVLFFHAPWCPQCQALEKSIQQGTLATGLTVFKVDFDTAQALRQKYGVTMQTSLVQVAADGSLAKKFVAYDEPNVAALNREFGR